MPGPKTQSQILCGVARFLESVFVNTSDFTSLLNTFAEVRIPNSEQIIINVKKGKYKYIAHVDTIGCW